MLSCTDANKHYRVIIISGMCGDKAAYISQCTGIYCHYLCRHTISRTCRDYVTGHLCKHYHKVWRSWVPSTVFSVLYLHCAWRLVVLLGVALCLKRHVERSSCTALEHVQFCLVSRDLWNSSCVYTMLGGTCRYRMNSTRYHYFKTTTSWGVALTYSIASSLFIENGISSTQFW